MKNMRIGCFLGMKTDYKVSVIEEVWYWCVYRPRGECKGVKDPVELWKQHMTAGVFQVTGEGYCHWNYW